MIHPKQRVRCECCGRRLKPFKYRAESPSAFRADTLALIVTADGRPPTLGKKGDNAFCSAKCGLSWAVARLRRDAGLES